MAKRIRLEIVIKKPPFVEKAKREESYMPNITIKKSIIIERPREEVYALTQDWTRKTQWEHSIRKNGRGRTYSR